MQVLQFEQIQIVEDLETKTEPMQMRRLISCIGCFFDLGYLLRIIMFNNRTDGASDLVSILKARKLFMIPLRIVANFIVDALSVL